MNLGCRVPFYSRLTCSGDSHRFLPTCKKTLPRSTVFESVTTLFKDPPVSKVVPGGFRQTPEVSRPFGKYDE